MFQSVRIVFFFALLVASTAEDSSEEDTSEESLSSSEEYDDEDEYGNRVVPNEYIITLKEDARASEAGPWLEYVINRIKDNCDCEIRRSFTFGDLKLFLVRGRFRKVMKAKRLREVAFVEKNVIITAHKTPRCAHQGTGRYLWGLSRISRTDIPTLLSQYNWSITDDGRGVDAYILDSGININHPDFEGRATWSYTEPSLREGPDDHNGHGTHVAGTVGGKTYGVAKGVNLISVKVLDGNGKGHMDYLLGAMEHVYYHRRGPAVVHLSLGAMGPQPAMETVINTVIAAGIVVVAAAGNKNIDACEVFPARMPNVITVGATNIEDHLAGFSNYGRCVDILAPGENIWSASHLGDDVTKMHGTSMAAPHVTGVVAEYLSAISPGNYRAIMSTPTGPIELKKMIINSLSIKDKITIFGPFERRNTPNRLLHLVCYERRSPPQSLALLMQRLGIGLTVFIDSLA